MSGGIIDESVGGCGNGDTVWNNFGRGVLRKNELKGLLNQGYVEGVVILPPDSWDAVMGFLGT